MNGIVVAVSRSAAHTMRKPAVDAVRLLAALGVEGDAHLGITVKHRSRVRRDPTQPNLRQVHLLHAELLRELRAQGFALEPGEMGENITTRGIDLLGLPTGTLLRFGDTATVEVTGLRNPCQQINGLEDGLLKEMVGYNADGALIRKAGVMAIVRDGGTVRPGDPITVLLPTGPAVRLQPV